MRGKGDMFMENIAVITMNPATLTENVSDKTLFTPESKFFPEINAEKIIKIPNYVNFGDDVVNIFMNLNVKLPEKPEFQNMLDYVYFSHLVAFYLSQQDYDKLLFEDSDLRDKILVQFKNQKHYLGKTALL